jgi:hypothetical protein
MRIGVSRAFRPRLHTRRPYSRSLLELATSFSVLPSAGFTSPSTHHLDR